ncbi:hypothetical protein [Acidomonas methanolica]|nr:hypothetical protein [Acidomonas methanolica]
MVQRPSATSALDALRPARKERVIDLVRAAGLDVADWSNSRRGEAGAATNPKYCYEWVFVEPGKAIVLNLWHVLLREETDGRIVHRGNFREDAEIQFARGRGSPWGLRARRLDAALQDNLEVRVILNAGVRRDRDDTDAEASKVELRTLDPKPWSIAAYDAATGAHLLVRGATGGRPVCLHFGFHHEVLDQPFMLDGSGQRLDSDFAMRHLAGIAWGLLELVEGHENLDTRHRLNGGHWGNSVHHTSPSNRTHPGMGWAAKERPEGPPAEPGRTRRAGTQRR